MKLTILVSSLLLALTAATAIPSEPNSQGLDPESEKVTFSYSYCQHAYWKGRCRDVPPPLPPSIDLLSSPLQRKDIYNSQLESILTNRIGSLSRLPRRMQQLPSRMVGQSQFHRASSGDYLSVLYVRSSFSSYIFKFVRSIREDGYCANTATQ